MVLLRILLVTVNKEVNLVEVREAFSNIKKDVGSEAIKEIEVFPSIKEGPPDFLVSVLFDVETEAIALSEIAEVLKPVGNAMANMKFIREAHGYFFDASYYYS